MVQSSSWLDGVITVVVAIAASCLIVALVGAAIMTYYRLKRFSRRLRFRRLG